MRPLYHRQPAAGGALLDRDEGSCEAIADGYHLHDTTIRLAARAAGPGRLVLVTDAMTAATMPDSSQARSGAGDRGRRSTGPGRQHRASRPDAGSTASIVRHAAAAGLPVPGVAPAAGTTPARIPGTSPPPGPRPALPPPAP